VLVYTACEPGPNEVPREVLARSGVTVVDCARPGQDGRPSQVDLAAMLADLARREVNELHVEAGHQLNGALWREGLVDELLLYLAPKLLGSGAGVAAIGPLSSLAQGIELAFTEVTPVGSDLRLRARPPGRAAF
jgi:diaminohydroxyphosphoribosylaminopyrimidine deaminase / 5-amino-6-(5-phosphoribosylamino)uracil reductase